MRWNFTITSDMREAGLTGNPLLVYAVLHGYSANGQGCFYGTVGYLAELVGLSRRATAGILRDLERDGFIVSQAVAGGTTRYMCAERTDMSPASHLQNLQGGAAKSARVIDNKIYINKNINTQDKNAPCVFKAPTVEEVAAYCRERGNNIDPAAFVARYESNGWKVGKAPMKDWKAAVRYWETQERPAGSPTPKAPSRQQSAYEKMAAMLQDNHAALAALADEEGGEL